MFDIIPPDEDNASLVVQGHGFDQGQAPLLASGDSKIPQAEPARHHGQAADERQDEYQGDDETKIITDVH